MIATVISYFPQRNSMIGLYERQLYVCNVGVCNISGSYSGGVEDLNLLARYDSM